MGTNASARGNDYCPDCGTPLDDDQNPVCSDCSWLYERGTKTARDEWLGIVLGQIGERDGDFSPTSVTALRYLADDGDAQARQITLDEASKVETPNTWGVEWEHVGVISDGYDNFRVATVYARETEDGFEWFDHVLNVRPGGVTGDG